MKFGILATVSLLATIVVAPAIAQSAPQADTIAPTLQSQVTSEQILTACVQNRAETLPIPFTDISPNDWAFKAVMTMYYCGAFRQATPSSLFQRLTGQPYPGT